MRQRKPRLPLKAAVAGLSLLLALSPAPGTPDTLGYGQGPPQQSLSDILDRLNALDSTDTAARIALSREGLRILERTPDPSSEITLRKTLAKALAEEGDSPESLEAAEAWRQAALEQGSPLDLAEAEIHLGWVRVGLEEFDSALEAFLGALSEEGLADHPSLRALALHGIGRVHATRGDFESALEPLEESEAILRETEELELLAEVLSALGIVQAELRQLAHAEECFQEARDLFQSLGASRKLLVVLGNLAVIRDEQGDPEGALQEFLEALPLASEVGTQEDQALAHLNVGETLIRLEQEVEAVSYLQRSLELAEAAGARQIQSWGHESLSLALESLGRPAEALFHYKESKALQDLLFNEENEGRIAELQARFDAEVRERENDRLRVELALQGSELRRNRTTQGALIAGAILLITALGAVVSRSRSVRRMNRTLSEKNEEVSRQKAEMESLHAHLEERVRERTGELTRVNQELQQEMAQRVETEREKEELQARFLQAQKMEAVGLLAGGVAHDFNNILTGIGMTCEMALAEADEKSPLVHDLQDVLKLSNRAARLTRQLLAFSRQQVLHPRAVALNDLIGQSLEMIRRIIGEDILVEFRPGTSDDVIQVDPTQVEQVLVNLAINARDAMPEGGPLLLETGRETVREPDSNSEQDPVPGEYVRLVVTDQGMGMEEDVLRSVFDPFFTTKPTGQGTGLGLATVYGIVRQHGGVIRATSEPGVGTSFTILLPKASARKEEPSPAPEPKEAPLLGRGKVLVLEDDDSIRELIERFLSGKGFEVLTARVSAEADELLHRNAPDIRLLISDVVLPGGSGLEFYDTCVRPNFPDIRILFISGYPGRVQVPLLQGQDPETALPFLEKPFSRIQLLEAVEQALTT